MDSGQLSSCLSRPMQDAGSHGANKSEGVRVTLAEKFTALHSALSRSSRSPGRGGFSIRGGVEFRTLLLRSLSFSSHFYVHS